MKEEIAKYTLEVFGNDDKPIKVTFKKKLITH
jgi:hypothetical protein